MILFWVAQEMLWCFFSLRFKDLLGDIMASKRDLRSYFVKRDNTILDNTFPYYLIFVKHHGWNGDSVCSTGNQETSR